MTTFSSDFFWVKAAARAVLDIQSTHPASLHWHDGVFWRVKGVASEHPGLESASPGEVGPTWLPQGWESALFLGWNRWGQPVVLHGETGVRHVRRGLRVWIPFGAEHAMHADVLYLRDASDWESTLSGWKALGLFTDATRCLNWLSAMKHASVPVNVVEQIFSSPTLLPEQVATARQLPYVPLSAQPHAAFVPFGLSGPTNEALSHWKTAHPELSMDAFVSRETFLDLGGLSGEQVDAVGLAVSSIRQKAAFLLGDQTGLGKGRVLASIAKWAQLQGLTPVFFTERPGLFHDFWRDLEDVAQTPDPFNRAFVLHQSPKLTWPDGTPWKNFVDAKTKTASLKSGRFPEGINLVLTTYSQFNRKDPAKLQLLNNLGNKAVYLFDEAHNATGQSNVRDAIRAVRSHARGCVYASATFGKDADHVSFYTELLGKTSHLHDWGFWLDREDAEPLRVAVSRRLVRAGRMVRREQDLSGLVYTPREATPEELTVLQQRADEFSKFASGLLAFQTELVRKFPVNPKHKIDPQRLFGGRLYRLNRLVSLVSLIPSLLRVANGLLSRQIKPVFVCETTLEQALFDFEESSLDRSWNSFADVLIAEINDVADGWVLPMKGAQVDAFRARKTQFESWTRDTFSGLPPSPLDAVYAALSETGVRVGEISGRQQRLELRDGVWTPAPLAQDRVGTVRSFNSGDVDVLIVTRAGCAGISLHASERFKDQRPRELVEWQIPRNVAERVQFFGRVYRKGQVVPSGVSTLLNPLPSERRGHIWQARKMQQLFQFTVGQQHALAQHQPSEDYLSRPKAHVWAKLWIQHYPEWSALLGLGGDGNGRQVAWMDRLFSRLPLLSVKRQDALLSFFDQAEGKLFPSVDSSPTGRTLATFHLSNGLSLEGRLVAVETRPVEVSFDTTRWDQWLIELGQRLPYRRSFFEKLTGLGVGSSLRWRDASRRKLVTGRVVGLWTPLAPFEEFWPAVSVHVWSPELERSVWLPLQSLMEDASFQVHARTFSLDAADVAHFEQHRVVWALHGEPEHLLLWKAHHRLGEWSGVDPHRLWLPSFLTPERFSTLSVPLGQPQWVLRFAKMRRNAEELIAYDASGRPMHFSFSDAGFYTLTWVEGAVLDDGELVSVAFRQKYGTPRRLSDGRMAFSCDARTGASLVFHLIGRGVVFGVPPEFQSHVSQWEREFC